MALPRVLAGPIVRRVEPASCSFWVALSEQATVTARVWLGAKTAPVPDTDPPLAEGQLATRKLGTGLHIAVVTIDTSGKPLQAGELYSYDLKFALAGGAKSDLRGEKLLENEAATTRITGVAADAPLHRALGFEKDKLPTFLAPPSRFAATEPATPAAGLRIAHASCRGCPASPRSSRTRARDPTSCTSPATRSTRTTSPPRSSPSSPRSPRSSPARSRSRGSRPTRAPAAPVRRR